MDPEKEKSRYLQIRMDIDIQLRESHQLLDSKKRVSSQTERDLRRLRSDYQNELSEFSVKYDVSTSPRESFVAQRYQRIGQIDRERDELARLRERVLAIQVLSDEKADLQDQINRLYGALLGPVEDDLAGVRHMIVVSSGELLSLPFSLLVTKPPADGPDRYQTAGWLIRKHAVTQMPSVRTFTTFRRTVRSSAAPLPFVGFGNPAFKGNAQSSGIAALSKHCQLGAPVPPDLIRGLAPLPDTAIELTRVAATLKAGPGSIFLGADVTEPRLRSLPLDQYRVVYFATHGLLPGELRCQSQPALALSPADRVTQNRAEDGLLEASEIAGLKLDADLVVLSACNTGGGGSGKLGGESLSGLARAFFQAGTRSVLVSHWQVDSVATTRLMTRTFGHVGTASRRHIAAALQRAQLDLLRDAETAHPYFWAAFTLVGEGRDIGPKALVKIPQKRPQQVGQTSR